MTVLTDDRLTNTNPAATAPPVKYIIVLENTSVQSVSMSVCLYNTVYRNSALYSQPVGR